MKGTPLFILTFVVLTLASCTSKYAIKGTARLNQLSGKTIYLRYVDTNSCLVTLDSAQIIHGEFEMKGLAMASPQLVTLFMDDIPMTPLILEPGTINVAIAPNDLMITGTPLNNKLYSFYQKNQCIEQSEYFNQGECSFDGADRINSEHQQLIKNFMEYNQDNILGTTIYSIYYHTYPDLFIDNHYPNQTTSIPGISDTHPENRVMHSGYFLW